MTTADYVVFALYVLGVLGVGVGLSTKVKNSKDLFRAGGKSPWWASGLSGFMTMFSAGTFVVWGGIAYRLGFVAVVINFCYGIAALFVGWFVAGKWRRLDIETPAEFLELRFGRAALHVYTWSMMVYRLVGVGVSVYALAKIMSTVMPLDVQVASLVLGGAVTLYTMVGGLWAVLMTDVLQFLVLNLMVLFLVPLAWGEVGGWSGFTSAVPEDFFAVTGGDYTWFFLAGWCAIHFFVVGAEWAFVQRYQCVPTVRDAKKSAWLFGVLCLVSPVLWLIPPLAYRAMDPSLLASDDPVKASEAAYVLACTELLPIGMVGMMLAAMFSATASMVSSQLNVFAGVLTQDIVRKIWTKLSEAALLRVGRLVTLGLGLSVMGVALAVPSMGGAEGTIISITALLVGPLLAPTIFGLFDARLRASAVWIPLGACFVAGVYVKFFAGDRFADWGRVPDITIGVVLPVAILTVLSLAARGRAPITLREVDDFGDAETGFDPVPGYIVAGSTLVCAVILVALVPLQTEGRGVTLAFSVVLLMLGSFLFLVCRKRAALAEIRES